MVTKRINTSVSKELWKEAQINEIPMSTALETGLKLILGNSNEKGLLKNKIRDTEIKLKYYNQRLADVVREETENRIIEEKRHKRLRNRTKFFDKHKDALKIIKKKLEAKGYDITHVYEQWNHINKQYHTAFGESLQQTDFIEICRNGGVKK